MNLRAMISASDEVEANRLEVPRMQRARGEGRIAVKQAGGRTRIDRLFQEGAAKIRIPHAVTAGLEAVLINTAGGLTGGDRMTWRCDAAPDTQLTLTTQACEKTYKAADAICAEVGVSLSAGAGASLCWLPQETILFDQARLARKLDIDLAADARALIVEPVIFGRKAMGETVVTGVFRDRWRVRVNGSLIHAEDFSIGPEIVGELPRAAVGGEARAFATLLLVGPDAGDRLGRARRIIADNGGASAWTVGETGKLLARVVAKDGYTLRKTLTPLIGLLNPGAGLPKIWST